MRKRLLLRLGLLACLGLAGFALYLWWCLTGVSGITRASVWRIKVGMTTREVDSIIGVPCGDYRSNKQEVSIDGFLDGVAHIREWYADSGTIFVHFDAQGRVFERSYLPYSESFLDRLYQWLGIDDKVRALPTGMYLRHPPVYLPPSA